MSGSKLLIVDDEASARKSLARVLHQAGFDCSFAANVQEAKARLNELSFDLVLTDVNMPGESGIDLARHVTNQYPGVGLIFVTAIEKPISAEAAMELDILGFLLKPFSPIEILVLVRTSIRLLKLEKKRARE